jgi:hypothetical protein
MFPVFIDLKNCGSLLSIQLGEKRTMFRGYCVQANQFVPTTIVVYRSRNPFNARLVDGISAVHQ